MGYIPRSNMHGRKRSFTEKYDDLHDAVLRSYIFVTVYGQIRSYTESVTFDLGTQHIQIRDPIVTISYPGN
jgi:hypothetical protein